MLAAIAALAVMGLVTPVVAQSPNFPNFSSVTNITFNGNAAQSGTVLRLTPAALFQDGSAWFNIAQPVAGSFSTTFTFRLSGTTTVNADGIAFVIQNSALTALGPTNDGCGIGFGDSSTGCAPPFGGITNSLAVEFDTYQNADDPNNNHVSIQSCLTGPNSIDSGVCRIADNHSLNLLPVPITLADGSVHTVQITYSGPGTKLLDVILDGNDLFPGGVVFDLTTLGLNSGNAWVGFTAATGGGDDNQDILSWTFTPQSQTAVVSTTVPSTLTFPNSAGNNVYDFTAQLTAPYPTPVMQVQPILMTGADCDALVQKNFFPAQCFIYQDAENTGMDAAVMFAVTCPDSPGGTCGSNTDPSFSAELGTEFQFLDSDNPFFIFPGLAGPVNPRPGWLKGAGPDPLNPCTPPTIGALFQSNQIDFFSVEGDPGGKTKGTSGNTGSCWVATYGTPGENPPGIKISSPKATTYTKGQNVPALYTCSNPNTSKPVSNPTGPYLTVTSCTQVTGTQTSCTQTSSGLACTGTVDTATAGRHLFEVLATDSGQNQNVALFQYHVK